MKNSTEPNVRRDMISSFIERQLKSRLTKLENLRRSNDKNIEYVKENIAILSQQLDVEDPYALSPQEETLQAKIKAYCNDIKEGIVTDDHISEHNDINDEEEEQYNSNPSRYIHLKSAQARKSSQVLSSHEKNHVLELNKEKSDSHLSSFDNLPSGTETRSTSAKSIRYSANDKAANADNKLKLTASNGSEKSEPIIKSTIKKEAKSRESTAIIAAPSSGRFNTKVTKQKEETIKPAHDDKNGSTAKGSKGTHKELASQRNPTPIRGIHYRKTSEVHYRDDFDRISESAVSEPEKFKPIRGQKVEKTSEITKATKKLSKNPSEAKLQRKEETTTKVERNSNPTRLKVKHATTNEKKSLSPSPSTMTLSSNDNVKKSSPSRSKTPTRHLTLNDATPVKSDQLVSRRSVTPTKFKCSTAQSSPSKATASKESERTRSKSKTKFDQPDQAPEDVSPTLTSKGLKIKKKTKGLGESETPSFQDAKVTQFKSQNLKNQHQNQAESDLTTKVDKLGKDQRGSMMNGEERWDKGLLSLDLKEMEQENLLASLDHIEDKLHYKEFREEMHLEEEARRYFAITEEDAAKEAGSPNKRNQAGGFKSQLRKKNLQIDTEGIEKENEESMANELGQENGSEANIQINKDVNDGANLAGKEVEVKTPQKENREENREETARDFGKVKGIKINVNHKSKGDGNQNDGIPFESENSPIERNNDDKGLFSYREEVENEITEMDRANESDNQSQGDINYNPNNDDQKLKKEEKEEEAEKEENKGKEEEVAKDACKEENDNGSSERNNEVAKLEKNDNHNDVDTRRVDEAVIEDGNELPNEDLKEEELNYDDAKKFWVEQEANQNLENKNDQCDKDSESKKQSFLASDTDINDQIQEVAVVNDHNEEKSLVEDKEIESENLTYENQ